jgi:hypothetical protein
MTAEYTTDDSDDIVLPLPLPRSPVALQSLLTEISSVIRDLSRRVDLDDQSIFLLEQILRGGCTTDEIAAIGQRLDELNRLGAACRVSPPTHLWLYLPAGALAAWSQSARLAVEEQDAGSRLPRGPQHLVAMIISTRTHRDGDRAVLALLNVLVIQIHQLLEQLATPDRPEEQPENQERPRNLPRNRRVMELARRIRLPENAGRTQREIANEVTDGDEAETENILRQLRDRPDLLEG